MSLTDEIYTELMDGLEKGPDWQGFLAKYRNTKGPLYNALGRVIREVEGKIRALTEKKVKVQEEVDQAGLTLDSLDRKIKEAESNVAALDDKENVLHDQIETLEAKLAEKSEFATHLAELERLGFNIETLRQLQEALREIGARHGLKGKQAATKFFGDLKDYEGVLEAQLQLKGLESQVETKRLEVENWQAKEEALRRKHDELKEAIGAVHALRTRNIKVSQVISWQRILSQFETVEQFEESMTQYGDITKLLNARKEEAESYELRLTKAQSQVETLEKERAKIEAAIDTLRVAGLEQVKAMTDEAMKQLKAQVASEVKEIQAVGQNAKSQFDDCLTQLNVLTERAYELGEKIGQMGTHLQKYEAVKDVLECHAGASETVQ